MLIMLGDGQGNFTSKSFPATAGALAVADINFDNKPDLVTLSSAFLGVGDGTFVIQTNVFTNSGGTFVITGDLNLDGKLDVVSTMGTANGLRRFLNQTPPAQVLPPRLGGRFKLQWPAWPESVLESSTNLSVTNGWVVVTNVPFTDGAARVLTNRFLDDQRFYRLRAP